MRVRTLLLTAIVLTVGFAPAPFVKTGRSDPSADDLRKMQGAWVVVKYELGGKDYAHKIPEVVFAFQGRRMTYSVRGTNQEEWAVEVNARAAPRELTTTRISDSMVVKGIYRFDGDQLTLCEAPVGKARPTRLDSADGRWLTVLRRR